VEAARDARTGKRVWRAAWNDPDCDHERFEGSSLPGVTEDGGLTLRDPATGKVTWRGDKPGRILDTDGRNVLVASGLDLTLYGKGRTWMLHDVPFSNAFLTKGRLLVMRYQQPTLAYNLRTGKPIGQVEGNLATVGDGWVATVGYNDGKTTITVYRL
jgi:hypothetical protein